MDQYGAPVPGYVALVPTTDVSGGKLKRFAITSLVCASIAIILCIVAAAGANWSYSKYTPAYEDVIEVKWGLAHLTIATSSGSTTTTYDDYVKLLDGTEWADKIKTVRSSGQATSALLALGMIMTVITALSTVLVWPLDKFASIRGWGRWFGVLGTLFLLAGSIAWIAGAQPAINSGLKSYLDNQGLGGSLVNTPTWCFFLLLVALGFHGVSASYMRAAWMLADLNSNMLPVTQAAAGVVPGAAYAAPSTYGASQPSVYAQYAQQGSYVPPQ